MPFGVVSGVGRGMGLLDESEDRRREGALFKVNAGHPTVTNGIVCVRGGDAALPKLLWDFLFITNGRVISNSYKCDILPRFILF